MARYSQSAGGKGKKGTRAYLRNKKKCERYRAQGRREKNKARRMAKRLRRYARRKALRNGGFLFDKLYVTVIYSSYPWIKMGLANRYK